MLWPKLSILEYLLGWLARSIPAIILEVIIQDLLEFWTFLDLKSLRYVV